MNVGSYIALLNQLISMAIPGTAMVMGWIKDRTFLQDLQKAKGDDYVPTAADFAPYNARSAAAEAQIDANDAAANR